MTDAHFRVRADPQSDRVLVVTLDRPERRNAMSADMVIGLSAWLGGAEAQSAGAIVIYGAGSGLCAGSDIAMLAAMDNDQRSRFEFDCGDLAIGLARHPAPIVAAVHGFAIGGGLTLAAACDVVISHGDARWSLPEVPIGLFPAWGIEAVAARIGRPATRRLSLGLDVLSGTQAMALGLADDLHEDPIDAALTLARRMASLPRAQVHAVKQYFAPDESWQMGDARANRLFIKATGSATAKASFARFAKQSG